MYPRYPARFGVLMGYGYRHGRDEGQVVLPDVRTCEPVATGHLPQPVMLGFWAPAR